MANPFESPEISSSSTAYNIDELLDLYHTHRSPARNHRSSPNAHPKLSLPSRTSSPDNHLTTAENTQDDTFVVSEPARSLGKTQPLDSASEGEETASEIDLNEPLDMMAVRLGYQLHLADGSDSGDDSSPLARNDEFDEENDEDEDDEELMDNRPAPSRGPSRQSLFKIRSHSSLRATLAPSRCRPARVVIAEASSSDEEQFDLSLDHAHLPKHDHHHQWTRTRPRSDHAHLPKHDDHQQWSLTRPRSDHAHLDKHDDHQQSTRTRPRSDHAHLPKHDDHQQSTRTRPRSDHAHLDKHDDQQWSLTRRRSSVGSAATLASFTTTPSSSHSSCPTNASTPSAALPPTSHEPPAKGLVGLGFHIDRASQTSPMPPLCKREYPSSLPQERASSLPGLAKPALEASIAAHDPPSPENPRASRRLKPLMLVSRKDRHLSYPLISATIAEEDLPPPTRFSATPPAIVTPARAVRGRSSLASIGYHRSAASHQPLLLKRPSAAL